MNWRCLFWLFCVSAGSLSASPKAAVTYEMNQGRFGDQLLCFAHAAWFSYSLDLPLLYQPFDYSDQLKLHTDPTLLSQEKFAATVQYRLYSQQDYLHFFRVIDSKSYPEGALFVIPFYSDSAHLLESRPQAQFTEVNWKDPAFLQLLRSLIAPLQSLPRPQIPPDCISVALHYRTGAGYDTPGWKKIFPLKGPPDSYYKDALRLLSKIVDKPLYVYIFTDHPHPETIAQKFAPDFPDLHFDFRKEINRQDLNVLEDFFAFAAFDCLIRPESNFSYLAGLLFPFKIQISPAHFKKKENTIHVDQFLLEYGSTQKPIRTILRL